MKVNDNKRNYNAFGYVLFISTILWFFSIALFVSTNNKVKSNLIDVETIRVKEHYVTVVSKVIQELEHVAIFTESVGTDNINDENFSEFVSRNEVNIDGLINYSIAPGGVQEFIYSTLPDEIIKGHDLLNDERELVREAVEYAILSKTVVINGPYELRQGGEAIVFRKAVYENGEFASLVNIVIENEILKSMFNEASSDIIDVGIFDNNNNLLFGDFTQDKTKSYDQTKYINNADWTILVGVSDTYRKEATISNLLLISVSLIIYIVAFVFALKFYRNNKKLIKRQEKLINYDNLTGLPNRRLLSDDINILLENDTPFYLGFGDLDNFKNLNDILGHSVGDKYLKDISDRFHSIIDNHLTIYRWGGDEFIFLFRFEKKAETVYYLKLIYSTFREPIIIKETNYSVSMSIGVVNYPSQGDTIDDLIKRADIVMYDIKSQQKNTYGFFEDKYLDNLQREVDFENKLYEYSLSDVEVYLQPVVRVKNNEIVGFEALTRLFDNNGKLINTSEMIKVYERRGDIFKLDKHIVEQAFQHHVMLKEEFNEKYEISFNISPITLSDEYIVFLKSLIKKYNVQPEFFVIEIIETTGFKDIDESVLLLKKLRKIGFKISMDDFGMGYSSLSYITRLPLSQIKIDRNFIQNYQTNEFDKLLILTIREISKSLNIEVVVEGIEEDSQLDFIREIGAHYYQGYLHSRPMSFKKLKEFLNEKAV